MSTIVHRLNELERRRIVDRVLDGWSVSSAAEAAGVSRVTAYKWLRRFWEQGWDGLQDDDHVQH